MDVKVLCITGWCRNGSTILGNVAGEIPGFFHVGELHFLWKNAAGKGVNNLCGCGLALTECPLWSPILTLGMPEGLSFDEYAESVMRRQRACVRTRHTWRLLRRGVNSDQVRAHAELMRRTFEAIVERTGARVIVDTTKIPGESALLPHIEGVTPYFVHLVRDPAAVAYSWREPKSYVYAMSAWKSTAYWDGFNLASHALTRRYPERSAFLKYEDFIADPSGTVDSLLRLCGIEPSLNPMRGHSVDLHTNHTVTGNPDRFRTGSTVIRDRDDGWKDGLPARAKLAAMAVSWPLSRRYGYRHADALRATGRGGPAFQAPLDSSRSAASPSNESPNPAEEGTVGSGA